MRDVREPVKPRARPRVQLLAAAHGVLFALLVLAPLHARAQVYAPELRTRGFGPDLQVQGGIGFGLTHKLDNNFLGRIRLGGLYAYEPWIANLGATLEVGGLASFGLGGELEINTFGGGYGQLGFTHDEQKAWLSHLGVGFMIFGLEWQHLFAPKLNDDALLFDVRVPLGIWWFLVGDDKNKEKKAREQAERRHSSFGPSVSENEKPAPPPGPSDDDRYRAEKDIERAREERAKGNDAFAAEALAHAYQLDPDPMILLLLVDAELAQGALVGACRDLKRFLDAAVAPNALAKKADAQAKLNALMARLAQLRAQVSPTPPPADARVEIDGQPALAVLLGYDVALDPGGHELIATHAGHEIAHLKFRAAEGEIVRVTLDFTEPAPARIKSE